MSTVVKRSDCKTLYSVHTPDYPSASWIINPDLTAVISVPAKYWKINPDDTVTEMTQPEKDTVENVPSTLASTKLIRYGEIDSKTGSLIAVGFAFDGKTFSLSGNAQKKILATETADVHNWITYPHDMAAIDNDKHILLDSVETKNFVKAAWDHVATQIQSGLILKKSIFDAVDKAAVDAVVDTR